MKNSRSSHHLFSAVYQYYQGRFEQIDTKKFHFASRLYLWNNDQYYKKKIIEMKHWFLEKDFLLRTYTLPQTIDLHFTEERKKQLTSFPGMLNLHDISLQALYAKSLYKQDVLYEAKLLIPKEKHLQLIRDLYQNKRGMAMLSTYSITYLFLYYRFLYPSEDFSLDEIYDIGLSELDINKEGELSMQIYYFTHCIIAESLFYARKIPIQYHPYHLKYILYVEKLISERYIEVSLDHKFEFLMCSKLLDRKSFLEDKIVLEASSSFAKDGDYFLDTLNIHSTSPKKGKNFFAAEHQNVLFLMALQTFKPHGLSNN